MAKKPATITAADAISAVETATPNFQPQRRVLEGGRIVYVDAQGCTVVQAGDADAKLKKNTEGTERFDIAPLRSALQTGKPLAINPDAHDLRASNTFGVK